MALSVGDGIAFNGYTGLVVATTATTDANGRFSVVYGGNTYLGRILRCTSRAGTDFPFVATADPYFRLALVECTDFSPARYIYVFDDLPGASGAGRWIEQTDWQVTGDLTGADAVVLTVGWRPGQVLIEKGGAAQASVYADVALEYTTSDGTRHCWWPPVYPFTDLGGTQVDTGHFRTDGAGELWDRLPDGTAQQIILPKGISAIGNRAGDRWTDGPVPERYLSHAWLYYKGVKVELTEETDVTLDIYVTINVTGPVGGRVEAFWEEGPMRGMASAIVPAGGTATITCPPGEYAIFCRNETDKTKGIAAQNLSALTCGQTYNVNLGSSWTTAAAETVVGVIYETPSQPGAGLTIYGTKNATPPGGVITWDNLGTTGGDGSFSINCSAGYVLLVVQSAAYGAGAFGAPPLIAVGYWDPILAASFGAIPAGSGVQVSTWEGIRPWGPAGVHVNLTAGLASCYLQLTGDTSATKHWVYPTGHYQGVRSDPLLRVYCATFPSYSSVALVYDLFDADGTLLEANKGPGLDTTPAWDGAGMHTSSKGAVAEETVGGKYGGSAVEADRNTQIVATGAVGSQTNLPEAARLGLEYGEWTQSLEHRSYSAGLAAKATALGETILWPLTFGDAVCAYCHGGTWCLPTNGSYTRGHCINCTDQGYTQDERTYFETMTLAVSGDWRHTAHRLSSAGLHRQRLVPGWPRPEEYNETAGYLVSNWKTFGTDRWVAVHIVLGTWNGAAFSDGESVADVETRLSRTVGPVMLKLLMTEDYAGTGATATITATDTDSLARTLTASIPAGTNDDDLILLDWYPHYKYADGYYIDVTNVTVAGNGTPKFQVVNDGPAWHSSTGVAVEKSKWVPWACDVLGHSRNPDLAQLLVGQGQQHLVWRDDDEQVYYQRTHQGGYAWSASQIVSVTQLDYPAVLKERDGGLWCLAQNAAGNVAVHRSRDDGRTWGSVAWSFAGQYPDLWRGTQGLQYLTVYSGGQHIVRHGHRGLSTVLGSGALTGGAAARVACVKKPHGELLFGLPNRNTIHFYNSRDDGRTFSHQGRDFTGQQIDLVLDREGVECAAILRGGSQVFVRGCRNFSTLLTWPSALAAGGSSVKSSAVIATDVDNERPAGLRLGERGNHLLCALTQSGVVRVYASRYGGLSWSRIA